MATPQRPRGANGGSSESVHLRGVGGPGGSGGISDSASIKGSLKGDTTPERPDIFGDILRTVPGGSLDDDDDIGLSFIFPQVPQQVTIQHNHQRQESQRVLARSPSPPRVSTPTMQRASQSSINHKGSQSSIAPIALMNPHTAPPPVTHAVPVSSQPTPGTTAPTPFSNFQLRKPGSESTQVHTYYILTLRDLDSGSETSSSSNSKHNSTSSITLNNAPPSASTRARTAAPPAPRKRARMEALTMETVDEEGPALDYIWWCIDVPYSENSKMEPLEVVKEFQRLPTDMKNAVIRMETELEIMGTDKSVIKWINYDKESKTLSVRYLQNARDVDSSTWD